MRSCEWISDKGALRPVDQISRIGMDTSKHIFQLYGVNATEVPVVLRKKLQRKDVETFFEKAGTDGDRDRSLWREPSLGTPVAIARAFGEVDRASVRVKPYVKRSKNDAADAEALCEAMSRPTMRFVPVKTAEQQTALNSRRGNHLGQRSCASASTGRTYGRKRSDQSTAKNTLRGGGRPHMGLGLMAPTRRAMPWPASSPSRACRSLR